MEIVLNLIGISSLTILFVTSEPMILLKRVMGFKEEEYMGYGKVKQFIYRLITCCLCSGFWISLVLTQSIIYSSIVSVLSELIYKQLTKN